VAPPIKSSSMRCVPPSSEGSRRSSAGQWDVAYISLVLLVETIRITRAEKVWPPGGANVVHVAL